jgi:hypothetical protein
LIYQADGENEVQRAGDPGELRELHRQEGHHPLGTTLFVFFSVSLLFYFSYPQNWLKQRMSNVRIQTFSEDAVA